MTRYINLHETIHIFYLSERQMKQTSLTLMAMSDFGSSVLIKVLISSEAISERQVSDYICKEE